ncbi:MAG: DUF1573 domain-containing protein [Chitinophagaceae bacterium]
MKNFFCTALSLTLFVSCLNKTDKENGAPANSGTTKVPNATTTEPPVKETDPSNFTSMVWIDSSKSMGAITQGEVLKISYRFKNTGTKPLIIESVKPGCGCTIADYPKQPISPGQEGEVKAEFDSHGKEGMQNKNISVTANTSVHNYTLVFDVTVNKPKS